MAAKSFVDKAIKDNRVVGGRVGHTPITANRLFLSDFPCWSRWCSQRATALSAKKQSQRSTQSCPRASTQWRRCVIQYSVVAMDSLLLVQPRNLAGQRHRLNTSR